jgi:MFS family permease
MTRTGWTPTSAALALGTLWGLAAMGTSAASVVLGDLRADLGLGVSSVAWVLTIFALTFAAATPVFGRLADAVGPRRPYVVGVTLLGIGALITATAPNLEVLLLGRAVQGIGAGSVPVLSSAILSLRFAGTDRTVAFGRVNSAVVVLASFGPIIGGVLGTLGGWRLPFALSLLALVILPMTYRLAPRGGTGEPIDLLGAALVAGTAASGLVLVQTLSALGPATLIAALATPLLGWLVARRIRRRPDGFLPAELAGNRTLLRLSVAAAAMPVVYFASLIVLPLDLAQRGWGPLANGLLLLPGAVIGSAISFNSARAVARWGRIGTAQRGLSLSFVGALGVAAVGIHPVLAAVGFIGLAGGYAMAQPTLVGEVSVSVPERLRGGALGVFNLVFFIGAGLGAAIVGGLSGPLGLLGALLVTAVAPLIGAALLARHRATT